MNPYSAVALERRDSAQRAGEVRRRLAESSREIDAEDSWVTISGRAGSGGSARKEQGRESPADTRGEQVEVSDEVVEPISVWA